MTQQEINNPSMLKVGTILHGTYRIDSYLSSGGFGNTYVATNVEFDERVAIKEFFMKGVTQRDDNQTTVSVSNTENSNSFLEQKEKFKKEARRIRQLHNPHIVNVHDLFEENGTAYYVMDYVDGENLAERLKRTGRPMTESEVRLILPQILDALKSVHDAGIWHLDLKPANIMLEKGGNVKLIDFGASKQLNARKGGATTSTAISYTNGYAPREQMEQNYDKFGPWTDIYALGATLYNLLTNKRPPLPSDIDDDESADKHQSLPFPDGISDEMKKLVLLLMHTNRKKRPQSVDELLSEGDKLIKSEDHPNISIEDKVVAPVDSEETIIASSVSEETRNEQYPPNNENDTDAEAASVISYYKNLDSESNDEDSGMTSGTKIILAILIGIIVLFVIIGGKGCGNEAQLPAEQQTEKNELQDNNNEVAPQTSTVKNGYFEESYNDGSSYKGNFKDGLYHGQGTYTWANLDKYEGEWVNGHRSKGTYTWPEKRKGYMYKYVGEFKNDVFEGKGTAYYVGGETESGVWKNGELIRDDNKLSSKNTDIRPRIIPVNRTFSTNYHRWLLKKIELQDNKTLVYWSVTSLIEETQVYNDGNEYILDRKSGKKYSIMYGSGIGTTNNPTIMMSKGEKVDFIDVYPALPNGVTSIDYYLAPSSAIKNINLK